MTEKKIEDITRAQIAARLPDALMKALNDYHRFSQQPAGMEARDFGDHQRACKTAIAHIELLVKLAERANLPDESIGDKNHQERFAGLFKKSKEQITAYKEEWENKSLT